MADPSLFFHEEASAEALSAFAWYAARSLNAAQAFQDELQAAGRSIQQMPDLWPRSQHGTRSCLMKRFLFVLVYRVEAEHIEILAVAHARRNPGYWKHRA